MQKLQIVIFSALALAFIAFVYTWRRGNRRTRRGTRLPSTRVHIAARKLPESRQLLAQVLELRAMRAQWPQIMAKLNPTGDSQLHAVLLEIRGPHMFDPHTGLGVIETGCRAVAPSADALAALLAARTSMHKVVNAGN